MPLSFVLLPFTTSGAKISIPLVMRYKLSLSPPLVLIAQYRLLTVYTTVFFLFLFIFRLLYYLRSGLPVLRTCREN